MQRDYEIERRIREKVDYERQPSSQTSTGGTTPIMAKMQQMEAEVARLRQKMLHLEAERNESKSRLESVQSRFKQAERERDQLLDHVSRIVKAAELTPTARAVAEFEKTAWHDFGANGPAIVDRYLAPIRRIVEAGRSDLKGCLSTAIVHAAEVAAHKASLAAGATPEQADGKAQKIVANDEPVSLGAAAELANGGER